MQREALRKLILDPQRRLFEGTAGIPFERAERIVVTKNWSLQDTVAHLVSWAEEIDREVRYLVEVGGGRLPWTISAQDNYSGWNQARIDEMENLGYSEHEDKGN